jgi:hypothetical protein
VGARCFTDTHVAWRCRMSTVGTTSAVEREDECCQCKTWKWTWNVNRWDGTCRGNVKTDVVNASRWDDAFIFVKTEFEVPFVDVVERML